MWSRPIVVMVMFVGLLAWGGCREATAPDPGGDSGSEAAAPPRAAAVQRGATLAELAQCAEESDARDTAATPPPAEGAPRPMAPTCWTAMFGRCDPAHASALPRRLRDVPDLLAACIDRYCARLEGSPPEMCAEGAAAWAGLGDVALARRKSEALLAAILGVDYGRPPSDPAIVSIAAAFARRLSVFTAAINVVPPSAVPRGGGGLDLHVRIDARGLTLSGAGLAGIEIAAGDDERLVSEARKLKALFPDATTVTIDAGPEIPMQTIIDTMDALRGEPCDMSRPSPSGCLFPHPIVAKK